MNLPRLPQQAWEAVPISLAIVASHLNLNHIVEIGPGRVLTGLIKRIATKSELVNISDANGIRASTG